MHFRGDITDSQTVDTAWSSFFGITVLADSKTLGGGQSSLYVVCTYRLFKVEKKKKAEKKEKKVAVAEPSVPLDVIEVRLTFGHSCHSRQCMPLFCWTESAS